MLTRLQTRINRNTCKAIAMSWSIFSCGHHQCPAISVQTTDVSSLLPLTLPTIEEKQALECKVLAIPVVLLTRRNGLPENRGNLWERIELTKLYKIHSISWWNSLSVGNEPSICCHSHEPPPLLFNQAAEPTWFVVKVNSQGRTVLQITSPAFTWPCQSEVLTRIMFSGSWSSETRMWFSWSYTVFLGIWKWRHREQSNRRYQL